MQQGSDRIGLIPVFCCLVLFLQAWPLLLVVGAAHALVALAGMAVAVRTHVDGFQLADVLRAVMTAGGHGAMNGLIHEISLQGFDTEQLLKAIVPAARRIMLPDNFVFAALQCARIRAIIDAGVIVQKENDLWNIQCLAKPA